MLEARIILPLRGNDGRDLSAVHTALKMRLAATWGGYTALPVVGGWAPSPTRLMEEPGIAYDVACPAEPATNATLRAIAREVGEAAQQEAIYLRLPGGAVEILPCAADASHAEAA